MAQDNNKNQKSIFERAYAWSSVKWKALLSFLAVTLAAVLFYLRSNAQKKVLQKANESHKKETEANNKARKELVDGLESIRKKEQEETASSIDRSSKKEKDLEAKKEEFIKSSEDDPDLAKKIAEEIGASFVERNKK